MQPMHKFACRHRSTLFVCMYEMQGYLLGGSRGAEAWAACLAQVGLGNRPSARFRESERQTTRACNDSNDNKRQRSRQQPHETLTHANAVPSTSTPASNTK